MQIAISDIADKFKLRFKRLLYNLGPEVLAAWVVHPLFSFSSMNARPRSLVRVKRTSLIDRTCNLLPCGKMMVTGGTSQQDPQI